MPYCREYRTFLKPDPAGVFSFNDVNDTYKKAYGEMFNLLDSNDVSRSNPSELLRIVDSGLRNHAYKFIRIEAFLSAISDWVRGLGISRSGARGVTFFRLNPNKNSMKLNGRYLHMPEGLGLCEAMEPYPFDGISYEDTAAVQVNRNKSGKYKIKVVKVKPAPFRGGRAITGDHAEYWESLMILRQILRDHRMGIDVESRLSDWLAYRSEILYNTDK